MSSGGSHNKISKHKREQIRLLGKNTMLTQEEIAGAVGASVGTVRSHLHKFDIKTAGRKIPLTKMAKIIKLSLDPNFGFEDIMEKLSTSRNTIKRVLNFYDLEYEFEGAGKGRKPGEFPYEPMELFEISDETRSIVRTLSEKIPKEKRDELRSRVYEKIREYAENIGSHGEGLKIRSIRKEKREKVARGAFKIVCKNMGIATDIDDMGGYREVYFKADGMQPQKPSDVCERMLERFDLSRQARQVAMDIANWLDEHPLLYVGKSLRGFAGACIYIACRKVSEGKTLRKIAAKVGLSENSIGSRRVEIQREIPGDIAKVEGGEKPLTDSKLEEMKALLEKREGGHGDLTYRKIAEKVGCSTSTVYHYGKRWNLT